MIPIGTALCACWLVWRVTSWHFRKKNAATTSASASAPSQEQPHRAPEDA
jgi:hypothetical protein